MGVCESTTIERQNGYSNQSLHIVESYLLYAYSRCISLSSEGQMCMYTISYISLCDVLIVTRKCSQTEELFRLYIDHETLCTCANTM